jgi:hypothetical protein
MKRNLLLFVILLPASLAYPQNFTGGFNFYLPPYDTVSTRFIPQFPKKSLTDEDFVSIDANGHFSVRGVPIRFFGVNETFLNMNPADLPSIIGRMRKMGFNIVRNNLIDGPWVNGSIFDVNPFTDTRHLNAASLNLLEYSLSLLKDNGLYAYISLLTCRKFQETDGVQDADSLRDEWHNLGASVASCFDPYLIFLQKEYARQLLTHVNPYTGNALINDPVMAVLEIQNEDYLYTLWRSDKIKPVTSGGVLISRHVRMLDSLWNDYLFRKYQTTEALGVAWSQGAENQIRNGSFETGDISTDWQLILPSPGTASATMSVDAVNPHSGTSCVKLDLQKVDGEGWHIQFRQEDLSILKDSVYVIQFSARSDNTCRPGMDIWGNTQYTYYSYTVTPEWQTFYFVFRAPETCTGHVNMEFYLGTFENAGTIWFDDIMMYKSGGKGLDADESLSGRSVRRISFYDCPYYTEQRVRDISDFYVSLQKNFFSEMSRFLKDTLHVRVPIVGTNMVSYLGDLVQQSGCDFTDSHAYYGSSSNDNMILNQDGGIIGYAMAGKPMKGKPYTISEHQYAWPNRYQSESPLVMSAYSSFHDIDGFLYHCYNDDPSKYVDMETDVIGGIFGGVYCGHFEINSNPAMMALMPSCSFAYRHGLVSKAKQTVNLDYSPDDYLLLPKYNYWWPNDPKPLRQTIALKHAVRTETFESPAPIDYASIEAAAGSSPYISDTKELTWNTDGLLSIGAGRFAGFTGLLNNFVNSSAGPMTIKSASGFGTLTWISLTEDSLQKADRSLITISTRAQNTGMVWSNGEVLGNNFGTSSTQVEPLTITLQLSILADSIRIFPLDTCGNETKGYIACLPSPLNTFSVAIDQSKSKTMWFGIERYKDNLKPVLNSRTPGKLDLVPQNKPQTFSVNVFAPTGDPLTYEWKINGILMQKGQDSSYTVTFKGDYNMPKSVIAVFSVPGGLKDSTTWNFTLGGWIIVDGEKDTVYNSITGPDNGHLQIHSFAFNDNGKPVNDADLSVKLWAAWDDQWFYLYEEVMDDTLSGNAPIVWDEDELELKIDPKSTDSVNNSIWETRLTALGMSAAGVVCADSLCPLANSKKQWVRKIIPGGYVLELGIRWVSIQSGDETITPAADSIFGLAINQHDNDGHGHQATVQWAAVLLDAVYCTPKYLGTVRFMPNHRLQFIPVNHMTGKSNPLSYYDPDYQPDAPVLAAPANSTLNLALNPTLSWNSVAGTESYTLQVSASQGFGTAITNKNGIIDTSQTVSGLANGKKYYWRVNATSEGGISDWSSVWNFTTMTLVGTDEFLENSGYLIYPNPAKYRIRIEGLECNTMVSLCSLLGDELKKIMSASDHEEMDLSALKAGLYLLKITNEYETRVIKIIKE